MHLGHGVWIMRHVKVLLQLHSIKLILFFALAVVFLALTAANSSNETKKTNADVLIANEVANSMAAANSVTGN